MRTGFLSQSSLEGSVFMALNSAVGSFDASQTIMSDIQPVIDYMVGEQTKTNEYNSAEAAIQRQFQATQSALEREFNASEAAKNRDWQEMMSNTAHQREVADLRAAGLNPVLSASGGNGAAVGSGATASQSGAGSGSKGQAGNINTALVSLFGTLLDNQTKLMMSMNSGSQANSYYDTQLMLAQMRREWELQDRAYDEDWYRRRSDIDTQSAIDVNNARPASGLVGILDYLFRTGAGNNPNVNGFAANVASDVNAAISAVRNWLSGKGKGNSFYGSGHSGGNFRGSYYATGGGGRR